MNTDRCDHPGTVWRRKQEIQGQTEEGWLEKTKPAKRETAVKAKEHTEIVS